MDDCDFLLCGEALRARASGALWWPVERTLVAADLHLGKSERLARRGGPLLPPYETAATLERLAAEIAVLAPARVICLGDSFDHTRAVEALAQTEAAQLATLMTGRDWVWVAGNHDPAPLAPGGRHVLEARIGGLTFRHEAGPASGDVLGEVSGHLHPKLRLVIKGRSLARPCFVHDAQRLMLPAFGAYTGGLWTDHPAIRALFGPGARAILTGRPCRALPLTAAAPAHAAG